MTITRPPKTVQELVEMRSSLKQLPESIKQIQSRIEEHVKLYEEVEGHSDASKQLFARRFQGRRGLSRPDFRLKSSCARAI